MKKLITLLVLISMPLMAFAVDGPAKTGAWRDYNITMENGYTFTFNTGASITATDGILNAHESWVAPAAKDTDTIKGVSVSTAILIAGTTGWQLSNGSLTDIIIPRNLTTQIAFENGTATAAVTASLAIVGVGAKGQAVTETIAISTTSTTGNEAYSSITSITMTTTGLVSHTDNTEAVISIGIGDKLGLANNIGAVGDVYKIVEGDVLLVPSSTYINATYDTYAPADIPDGTDNFEVWYNARSRE